MVTIKPSTCAALFQAPNMDALLAEYTAECSIPTLGPIAPQKELYTDMEKSGGLQAFGVYEGDLLIGFAVVLIYVLPHYGKKIASTESIFTSKNQNSVGIKLMTFIESYAKAKGCVAFLYSAPINGRFARLLSLIYKHTSNVYLRSLA